MESVNGGKVVRWSSWPMNDKDEDEEEEDEEEEEEAKEEATKAERTILKHSRGAIRGERNKTRSHRRNL